MRSRLRSRAAQHNCTYQPQKRNASDDVSEAFSFAEMFAVLLDIHQPIVFENELHRHPKCFGSIPEDQLGPVLDHA